MIISLQRLFRDDREQRIGGAVSPSAGLRRLRQMLEVGCDRCLHIVYVNPRLLPFHGLTAADALLDVLAEAELFPA